MSERFFVPSPIQGRSASLTGPEAHHLIHVMRGRIGDGVILFDGFGAEYPSRITHLGRDTVALEVLASNPVSRELPWDVVLGVALPKGERQRWLVEKAVELGVSRFVPLQTAHGSAPPAPRALERLQRTVVEAAKQCGRNRLMQIDRPLGFEEFIRQAPPESLRILADPRPPCLPLAAFSLASADKGVFFAVGPEGGFCAEELQAAAGWNRVSLGPRILRIETAAITLAAWAAQVASATE